MSVYTTVEWQQQPPEKKYIILAHYLISCMSGDDRGMTLFIKSLPTPLGSFLKDSWWSLDTALRAKWPRSYTQIRKTHTHTQTRLLRSGSRLVHQPVSLYPPLCSWWCVWIRTEALELITRTATTLTTTMMMTMKILQLGVQTLDRYPSQIATSVVCDFCADP